MLKPAESVQRKEKIVPPLPVPPRRWPPLGIYRFPGHPPACPTTYLPAWLPACLATRLPACLVASSTNARPSPRAQLLEEKWGDFLRAEALKEAVNNWTLAFPGEVRVFASVVLLGVWV